jgi:hypothetical protein
LATKTQSPLDVDQDPAPEAAPAAEQGALARLATLGAALSAAAGDEAKTRAATDGIVDEILALDKDTAQALLKRPEIRELFELAADEASPAPEPDGAKPPGTVLYKKDAAGNLTPFGKVPWTMKWLTDPPAPHKPMATKTFIPVKNTPIIWNGIQVNVRAMEEVTLPEVFWGVYRDSLTQDELAREHAAWLFKRGPAPRDRSIITESGALARGTGEMGWYRPGGGTVALGDFTPERAS